MKCVTAYIALRQRQATATSGDRLEDWNCYTSAITIIVDGVELCLQFVSCLLDASPAVRTWRVDAIPTRLVAVAGSRPAATLGRARRRWQVTWVYTERSIHLFLAWALAFTLAQPTTRPVKNTLTV